MSEEGKRLISAAFFFGAIKKQGRVIFV